tara:strand:+ start:936 stop:1070 length:135 start_codon:yes stop_codon:yes gene_type:complete
MPTYDEAKQMHKSAQEMKRKAQEAARKRKYNPDGTPRNTGVNEK